MSGQPIGLEQRFVGSITGAAVGDALGMPTEYISRQELNKLYNGKVTEFQKPSSYHPCAHLRAGQYTDDTQQLMVLAGSLIRKKGFDINDFGKLIGQWAHNCRTVNGYDRFSGGTSISAGLELYTGADPMTTGKPRATCGSAMRVAPLGLFYHDKIEELEEKARLSSIATHTHPAAVDSAVFISYLIAYLTQGKSADESAHLAYRKVNSDLAKNLGFVMQNKNLPPQKVMKIIGASESSYETVPMALHCFLHSPEDFERTVVEAANLVYGDTDSIACIAGAVSGAHNSIQAIPDKFKDNLEDFLLLQWLGKELLKASAEKKIERK